MTMMRDSVRHRGLTLVESLLASAILAFAVVAVSEAVIAGQMQAIDALHRARAVELGEALMEEVLRLAYADPDGVGEVGRANFDDLQDFNGFNETSGTLSDANGIAYDMPYQSFSRSVSVVPANAGSGINVAGLGGPLMGLTITVTVRDAAGAIWTLTRFRAEPPS
jgi:prepilin-type N-terminal cleavage/methylation domain-containing protein